MVAINIKATGCSFELVDIDTKFQVLSRWEKILHFTYITGFGQ